MIINTKENLFAISDIGIVSIYGISIGMTTNEVSQILVSRHIGYNTRSYGSEPLSDIEFEVCNHSLAEGIPPCELVFRFRYGQNLSFIKAGTFYSKLEDSKLLYDFFLCQVGTLGLNVQKWDNTDKENETLSYLYNWAQSVEVTLKESLFKNKQQNPVSLIIRPHEAQKMVAEICRVRSITASIQNDHSLMLSSSGRKKSVAINYKTIIVWILTVLLSVLSTILIIRNCSGPDTGQQLKDGLYSVDPVSNNSSSSVYICTSLSSKKYHSTPDCRWLENCSGQVKEISVTAAEAQGKTPCKGCY